MLPGTISSLTPAWLPTLSPPLSGPAWVSEAGASTTTTLSPPPANCAVANHVASLTPCETVPAKAEAVAVPPQQPTEYRSQPRAAKHKASAIQAAVQARPMSDANLGRTPSLAAIVAAYEKDGNGDRELLLALLAVKKWEDERLATRDILRTEELKAANLHWAYRFAAACPHYLRPTTSEPTTLPNLHLWDRASKIASSPDAPHSHTKSAGKRARPSKNPPSREDVKQALRTKISRKTATACGASPSAKRRAIRPASACPRNPGFRVSNCKFNSNTDAETEVDEEVGSPSASLAESSLASGDEEPITPPSAPAASHYTVHSTTARKSHTGSLAMLLDAVDQEKNFSSIRSTHV